MFQCLHIESDELDKRNGEVDHQRADEVHFQHAVALQRVLESDGQTVT